jgi:hypothetical protein
MLMLSVCTPLLLLEVLAMLAWITSTNPVNCSRSTPEVITLPVKGWLGSKGIEWDGQSVFCNRGSLLPSQVKRSASSMHNTGVRKSLNTAVQVRMLPYSG